MSAVVVAVLAFWLLRPAAPPARATPATLADSAEAGAVQRLKVKVLSIRPHDPAAYTQGLVLHGGSLYESTGLYGASSLREVNPQTGEVKRRVDLPQGSFAEGLALVGDRLIQLTWQEGVAFVWGLGGFDRTGEHRYQGEGWGLCYDGKRLVMSNGSDRLTFRDPMTFAPVTPVDGVRVSVGGRPINWLNELECVDGTVYANVWQTDEILRIDPATGKVTAVIDASGLLTSAERQGGAEVLNGIAYDPQKKTFLVTGKLWPKLFEVAFVPE